MLAMPNMDAFDALLKHKSFLGLNPTGFHHLYYNEWGDEKSNRTLICAHGLTRNSRDFDFLAQDLSSKMRIICPDVVGRGQSDRLVNPKLYCFSQYLADMTALIARLNVSSLDWLGTSMGGLIGMFLAAQPNSPVKRLILNDVGPYIPSTALRRIGHYAISPPIFNSFDNAEAYVRVTYAPFGALTDEQWSHITRHSIRQISEYQYVLDYDPALAKNLHFVFRSVNLWPIWHKIKCPALVIHGAHSDILTPGTVAEMESSHPDLQVITIQDAGHAPALMDPAQIRMIEDWLDRQ